MRCRTLLVGLTVVAILGALSSSPALAAPGRWTRIGPEGGPLCALAAAPARPALVYAGLGRGGVFRSNDSGRTWTFAGRGLTRHNDACSLAVDPVSPATVWAATTLGLFKTTDGGLSWNRIGAPPAGPFVNALWMVTAHPRLSGVVWVSTGAQLFQTRDGGTTWRALRNAPSNNVITLAVDPVHPATLYAGTLGKGAFKSTDGGATWTRLHTGPLNPLFIDSFVFDPQDSRVLFLVPTDGGLLKSTDAGATWMASGSGLGLLSLRSVAFDPVSPGLVYAAADGVYRSTNGGRSWHRAGPGLPSPHVEALIATPAGILAGTDLGTGLSGDHGATWQTGRGLSAASIDRVVVSQQDPPRIYAESNLGVWKTASRGAAWLTITPDVGPGLSGPLALALDPTAPDTVYVGFVDAFAVSTNGGRRWSSLPGLPCVRPDRLVIAPTAPPTLYSGGGLPPTEPACGPPQPDICVTFRSTDGGRTWSCIKDGLPAPNSLPVLAFDPFALSHLFTTHLDTFDTGSLYRSLDSGGSWALLAPGIAASEVVFDPHQPGVVYALTRQGIGSSADGGATWEIHADGLPVDDVLVSLILDPVAPSTLYAATLFNVYRSTDAGATWSPLAPGLEEVSVTGLAVDPGDSKVLYAATSNGGVMMLEQE